jgi:hypothetical protein
MLMAIIDPMALKFTKDRREAFLMALAATGIVSTAATIAGIDIAECLGARQYCSRRYGRIGACIHRLDQRARRLAGQYRGQSGIGRSNTLTCHAAQHREAATPILFE